MRIGWDSVTYELLQLMCMGCSTVPGTKCLDEDLRELPEVHPTQRLTIAEQHWQTHNGWVPLKLVERRVRQAARPQSCSVGRAASP